jgi:hypothetical protein
MTGREEGLAQGLEPEVDVGSYSIEVWYQLLVLVMGTAQVRRLNLISPDERFGTCTCQEDRYIAEVRGYPWVQEKVEMMVADSES